MSIRNTFDNAVPPTGTPLAASGDVADLTLFFDNTGVALPGYRISGNLSVTAGGDVTQPSFADSTVVAAVLGTISLSGVDPTDPDATAFGVAFRTAAGAAGWIGGTREAL
jgi:hypothetical protein